MHFVKCPRFYRLCLSRTAAFLKTGQHRYACARAGADPAMDQAQQNFQHIRRDCADRQKQVQFKVLHMVTPFLPIRFFGANRVPFRRDICMTEMCNKNTAGQNDRHSRDYACSGGRLPENFGRITRESRLGASGGVALLSRREPVLRVLSWRCALHIRDCAAH